MKKNDAARDPLVYGSSILFMTLMLFVPLFERYAYNFFYASFYALGVAFYAVFVKRHRTSPEFIMAVRALSFVYVVYLLFRFNPGFAIIGFLMIYQITRLLEGTFFENYTMSFLINLIILYLSLPNHGGTWIVLYFTGFVFFSAYFMISHSLFYSNEAAPEDARQPMPERGTVYRFVKYYAFFIIAAALLIFFMLPRLHFNFFNPFTMRFSGIASVFTFNSIENIKESSSVIMRITKDQDTGSHYKMKSYNRYWVSRREWIATSFGSRMLQPDADYNFELAKTTSELSVAPGIEVNTTFYMRQNPEGFVPHLYSPMKINLSTRSIYYDYMENMYSNENEATIKVKSFVINPDEQALKAAEGKSPQRVLSYYLMYPNNFPRIRDLAYSITRPFKTRYEKAAAIEKYLKDNFKYTMAVGDLYGEYNSSEYDPNEVFLFMVKAGHCELFASSMTLMCQSMGIPARLVRGFASPEYNENGNYYLVRGSDAHAWVEVHFPGIGFVTFDPTASSNENEKSRGGLMASLSKYFDSINFYIENYVSYYSNEIIYKWIIGSYRFVKDLIKDIYDTRLKKVRESVSGGGPLPAWMGFLKNPYLWGVICLSAAWFLISHSFKLHLFNFLNIAFDKRVAIKITNLLTRRRGEMNDFYVRFSKLFEGVDAAKHPSETPYEFHYRICSLGIIKKPALEKCVRIAEYFYACECGGHELNREEAHEIDILIMDIANELKTVQRSS